MNDNLLIDILIPHEPLPVSRANALRAKASRIFKAMETEQYARDADLFFSASTAYAMPARGSLSLLMGEGAQTDKTVNPYGIEAMLHKCIFTLFVFMTALVVIMAFSPSAQAEARLKDIASFEGVR